MVQPYCTVLSIRWRIVAIVARVQLSREDWIAAALQALADGGPAAVAVERLAARLQTTKGSFYWHFRDRAELVTEALATWERRATDALIEQMEQIADPVERLRRLMVAATELEEEEHPDVRLLPSASDPVAVVAEGFQPGVMPSYEGRLSDEQVRALAEYLLEGGEARVRFGP